MIEKIKKIKINEKKSKKLLGGKNTFVKNNNIIGIHSLLKKDFIRTPNSPSKITYLNLKEKKNNNTKPKILKSFSESKTLNYTNKKGKINKIKKLKIDNENKMMNSTLKTQSEMAKRFYIRYREGFKGIGKSNDLYSGFIRDPKKIIDKILFDYKSLAKYDKEVLLFNKNSYERNIEYIENQEKIIKRKRLKESILFDKLRRKRLYNNKISSININHSEMNSPLYLSSNNNNHKTKLNEHSLSSMANTMEIENKLEKKVKNSLKKNKTLMINKIKSKSIKFCNSIDHIDFMCRPYEPINEETSKINLRRNNYYNLPNLERISKLETIIKKGFDEDDFEFNGKYIKKFSKEYDFMVDKALFGYLPKFAKKGGFNNKTLLRFNNLKGKYFGFPT